MSSAEKTPASLADLPPCPVETTLTLISDKWKILILRDLLLHGTMRFGELKKSIGHVTQKVLTAQLRDMEAKGLLTRKVYAEVPPRVEYTLTATGYSLRPILDSMVAWGTDYQKQNGGAPCHKTACTAEIAAKIPCTQVLGTYTVPFDR